MKKATLIIWAIIFGVIALLIFQNQAFFLANQSLRVNLGIIKAYNTPELPIAILVLLFFLVGIAIAYLFSMSARFKARRTIKKLNATVASHNSEMAGLKREIDSLKGIETPALDQSSESKEGMGDTQNLSTGSLTDRTSEQTGSFSLDKKDDSSAENTEETEAGKK
jgi:uncharacterized integral membrane protein